MLTIIRFILGPAMRLSSPAVYGALGSSWGSPEEPSPNEYSARRFDPTFDESPDVPVGWIRLHVKAPVAPLGWFLGYGLDIESIAGMGAVEVDVVADDEAWFTVKPQERRVSLLELLDASRFVPSRMSTAPGGVVELTLSAFRDMPAEPMTEPPADDPDSEEHSTATITPLFAPVTETEVVESTPDIEVPEAEAVYAASEALQPSPAGDDYGTPGDPWGILGHHDAPETPEVADETEFESPSSFQSDPWRILGDPDETPAPAPAFEDTVDETPDSAVSPAADLSGDAWWVPAAPADEATDSVVEPAAQLAGDAGWVPAAPADEATDSVVEPAAQLAGDAGWVPAAPADEAGDVAVEPAAQLSADGWWVPDAPVVEEPAPAIPWFVAPDDGEPEAGPDSAWVDEVVAVADETPETGAYAPAVEIPWAASDVAVATEDGTDEADTTPMPAVEEPWFASAADVIMDAAPAESWANSEVAPADETPEAPVLDPWFVAAAASAEAAVVTEEPQAAPMPWNMRPEFAALFDEAGIPPVVPAPEPFTANPAASEPAEDQLDPWRDYPAADEDAEPAGEAEPVEAVAATDEYLPTADRIQPSSDEQPFASEDALADAPAIEPAIAANDDYAPTAGSFEIEPASDEEPFVTEDTLVDVPATEPAFADAAGPSMEDDEAGVEAMALEAQPADGTEGAIGTDSPDASEFSVAAATAEMTDEDDPQAGSRPRRIRGNHPYFETLGVATATAAAVKAAEASTAEELEAWEAQPAGPTPTTKRRFGLFGLFGKKKKAAPAAAEATPADSADDPGLGVTIRPTDFDPNRFSDLGPFWRRVAELSAQLNVGTELHATGGLARAVESGVRDLAALATAGGIAEDQVVELAALALRVPRLRVSDGTPISTGSRALDTIDSSDSVALCRVANTLLVATTSTDVEAVKDDFQRQGISVQPLICSTMALTNLRERARGIGDERVFFDDGTPRIGELMIALGHITRGQLDLALARQKHEQGSVGYLLRLSGEIDETTFIESLAIQLGLPWLRVERIRPWLDAVTAIPRQVAETYGVLGLASDAEGIDVGFIDPLDEMAQRAVAGAVDRTVRPIVIGRDALARVFGVIYA